MQDSVWNSKLLSCQSLFVVKRFKMMKYNMHSRFLKCLWVVLFQDPVSCVSWYLLIYIYMQNNINVDKRQRHDIPRHQVEQVDSYLSILKVSFDFDYPLVYLAEFLHLDTGDLFSLWNWTRGKLVYPVFLNSSCVIIYWMLLYLPFVLLLHTGETDLYQLRCVHGEVFLWDMQIFWWWCEPSCFM